MHPVVTEECHLKFILFLALVAYSCSGAERFEQFWLRTSQGTILSSLVEIRPVVMEKMSFFFFFLFFVFSSGSHFVQWSRTILEEDLPRINPIMLN